jgi:hypothetical protein
VIPCYKETAAIDTVAITLAWAGSFVVNVALEIEDSVDFSLYFSLSVSERSSLVTGSSAIPIATPETVLCRNLLRSISVPGSSRLCITHRLLYKFAAGACHLKSPGNSLVAFHFAIIVVLVVASFMAKFTVFTPK